MEPNSDLQTLAAYNFEVLKPATISTFNRTAEQFLDSSNAGKKGVTKTESSVFYIDPSRRDTQGKRAYGFSNCTPDVLTLIPDLLKQGGPILLKASPMQDLEADIAALQQAGAAISQIHIVSLGGEVKELLYLLIAPPYNSEPVITAINLMAGKATHHNTSFSFARSEEADAMPEYGMPEVYLFEPDAALLKAGAFKLIATRFKLKKLHINSHLYTGPEPIPGFPGRTFRVKAVVPPTAKALQPYLLKSKANLTVRNFPSGTEQLRKILKLAEGGPDYLFATTLCNQAKVIVICEKAGLTANTGIQLFFSQSVTRGEMQKRKVPRLRVQW